MASSSATANRFRLCILAGLLIAACSGGDPASEPVPGSVAMPMASIPAAAPATDAAALPAGHPMMGDLTPAQAGNLSGKAAEVLQAKDFTYVRLDSAKGEQWVVLHKNDIKKGQTLNVDVTMALDDFEAKSVNRTFKRVLFGTVEGAAGAASAMSAPVMPHADNAEIRVARADKTIAEVWAGREQLRDQKVAVRGKVVKFLPGIMGRNWVHLRDGSGTNGKGDDDLTVTTKDSVAAGDVVVATGLVRTDQDFGSGYRYEVLIEDARITP